MAHGVFDFEHLPSRVQNAVFVNTAFSVQENRSDNLCQEFVCFTQSNNVIDIHCPGILQRITFVSLFFLPSTLLSSSSISTSAVSLSPSLSVPPSPCVSMHLPPQPPQLYHLATKHCVEDVRLPSERPSSRSGLSQGSQGTGARPCPLSMQRYYRTNE